MRIQYNTQGLSRIDYKAKVAKILGRTPIYKDEFSNEFSQSYGINISACCCPNCGGEIFGRWNTCKCNYDYRVDPRYTYEGAQYKEFCKNRLDIQDVCDEAYSDYKIARYEAADFAELELCPLCGKELLHEDGYFVQTCLIKHIDGEFYKEKVCIVESSSIGPDGKRTTNYELDNLDSIFAYLKKRRLQIEQKQARDQVLQTVKQLDIAVIQNISPNTLNTIKETALSLQDYLQQLIRLESNIYFLTEHLTVLYQRKRESSRVALGTKLESAEYIRKETENARLAIQPLEKALQKEQVKPLAPASIAYPKKPTAPCAPTPPLLATPGFFNKKRVRAENEAKTFRYNQEMERYQQKQVEYEDAVAAYERQTEACRREEARQKEEHRQIKERAIQKAQDALFAAQTKYNELKATEETRIAELLATPVPADAVDAMFGKEITEAENLLKDLFHTRNALYAFNIIFSKYRNIVAISTFYEYLMTGRCSSLEGADGAYNLYESECRADMIISQLSVVIESLEQVKQNQYLIYSALQSIRMDLDELSSTMNAALTSIQCIEATTVEMSGQIEKIAENADVIAHNTAVTAHYSKVNAELTNALGYMIAFK